MADNEGSSFRSSSSASLRPTITLPPRSSGENYLIGGLGASPGPMTLVSNFFSESDPDSDCRSFSQLLTGALVSPAAVPCHRLRFPAAEGTEPGGGRDVDFRLKESRAAGLMISQSPMFTVPPGLSPASLLDSPGFFLPAQGHFGSHQLALAQVTAHAAQRHSQMPPSIPDREISADVSYSDQRLQPSSFAVDKPADDGYNWRKYGQKQVKGSEYPRSYYKCTHPNCPVKKQVERSLEGHVTEIIYKGQHNHQPPQSNKRAKDAGLSELGLEGQNGNFNKFKEEESSQATKEQLSGSGDSEEVGDAETGVYERDEDEPEPKRRNTEVAVSNPASSHRTVTEPRIIVQTTSEVDLLDDGYRWRKYGQKVVKGNPYPRSYYKCTSPGCGVRKHVERAATDPKAVITTYEGKHNHDVPAARNSSHNMVNNNASNLNPNNALADRNGSVRRTDFGNNDHQRIGLLQFKEERLT